MGFHRGKIILFEPGDIFFVRNWVFSSPISVVIGSEFVRQIVSAVVFAHYTYVVAVIS